MESKMKLNEIRDNPGARRSKIRICRGIGSGKGKTGGRGGKGQTARTGVAINGFEGGQMPIYRRLPKRGFTNIFALKFVEVNIGRLQQAIEAGKIDIKKTINGEALVGAGLIRRVHDGVRLLGKGDIKSKISIEVCGATKSAIAAVEKAGGSVMISEKSEVSAKDSKRSKKDVNMETKAPEKALNKEAKAPAKEAKAEKPEAEKKPEDKKTD